MLTPRAAKAWTPTPRAAKAWTPTQSGAVQQRLAEFNARLEESFIRKSGSENQMPKKYEGIGIAFLYPDNWNAIEDRQEDEVVGITLESPTGAFLSINRYPSTCDLDELVQSARQTMQNEYDEAECEPEHIHIAGHCLNGTVVRFYYLDLVVISRIFAYQHGGDTLLLQIQGEDRDMDRLENVFQAVLVSMFQSIDQ